MTSTRMNARNPLTGIEDYSFEISSCEAVRAACEAVRAAQPAWAALGVEGRAAALRALGAAFEARAAELYAALSADTGRHRIAKIEAGAVQGMITLTLANAATVLAPEPDRPSVVPGIVGRRQLVPYPLVGVIAPWNFPVVLSMIDAIPALMAGCGVVLKPSEVTPRYVEPLRRIFDAVPAVAPVFRIVTGPGSTGADLVDHADAIVCTGSVRTGRIVAEHAARRFIPAFLELGGNDAVIVTRSADLERAATAVLRASILASGQACQSLERVYVDRAVYAPFMERLLAKARSVRTTAEDPHGQIGPFIMARQAGIVRDHIEDAVAKGAKIELGGRIIERGGVWCEVTVLSGVSHRMKVMTEETFGPVIPVMPYDTIEEAIRLANEGDYGLSANVIAGSEAEAGAIAERLDAGFVGINEISMSSFVLDFEWEPSRFSGLGRARMGPSGIARYLRIKAVVTSRNPPGDVSTMGDR
ncbi:MAG: aldehyde dehydrogenase family protein [Gammaproteobacteria bacterium]|nr:aldehyde dehydrogenase family protein [Gammaproteobacteria bacterium]